LFIGYAKPGDAMARIAFAAGVATGIVYLQVSVVPGVWPLNTFQPVHMVLGYHFFYRFPGGVPRGRLSRALLWFFYAWSVAAWGIRQPLTWTFLTGGAGAAAAWAARH